MARASRKRQKRRSRAARTSSRAGSDAAPAEAGSDAAATRAEAGPQAARERADGGRGADPPPRRKRGDKAHGPPPAPWGSFPLVELAVLFGIGFLVAGFLSEGTRQGILIGTGLLLASVAGLELAIREHLGGYRSHTLVLAAVPAVATLAVLFYVAPESFPALARVAVAAAVFAASAWALTALFRRQSGGYSFRVKSPRS